MAASFLCQITGLGSRNTADHHLRLIESLGVMEKRPGRGGKDRKSNTYVFLGGNRNWRPLPTERPGTDPWVALARSRRENEALRTEIEELQAELARHMNGGAIAHPELSNGDGVPHQEQPSHSHETAGLGRPSEESIPIAQSELSNGLETAPTQEASHSYETADSSVSPEESIPIAHPELSNGPETAPTQETYPQLRNHRFRRLSRGIRIPIAHSELSNGSGEGQEYLARRDRVESLVMKHRAYYDRSFHRRGVLGAIEYFSRSAENERELVRQVGILDAGHDPARASDEAQPADGSTTPSCEPGDRPQRG